MKPNAGSYTNYREEQFAADEYFQKWVLHPDTDNSQFWTSYLQLHPEQQKNIARARLLVEELAASDYGFSPLTEEERAAIKKDLFSNLSIPATGSSSIPLHPARTNKWRYLSAAALMAILVIPAWLLLRTRTGPIGTENKVAALTITTGATEMKRITLEDSTLVILNANSTLEYRNGAREIRITGNAYLKVKKDPGHTPFIVHTQSLAITVLGTELNVNARSIATEVTLTSGKIKVQQEDGKEAPTYLQPGEKIKWDTSAGRSIISKMDPQLYSAWTEGQWNFRQTTLEDITSLLSAYYGVEVLFRNEKRRHARIDAVIPVSSLQTLIPVIAHTLQIRIVLIHHQLIIS
jgi:ferric-dicitrate binding protein FerR (iron transport regulator)